MSEIVKGHIVLNAVEQARYDLHEALQKAYPRQEGESRLDWEIRLIGIRNQRLKDLRDGQKNEKADDRQAP